jgi:hypothetical protein
VRARRLASLAVLGLIGLFTLNGCALYFRGAGAIASPTLPPPAVAPRAGAKAVFAFVFEAPKKKLKGVYYDQANGIFFFAEGLTSYVDNPGVRDECMQAVGRYRSKIKGKPGEGRVQITACDNGNPGRDPNRPRDQLGVQLLDGPLGPYAAGGELVAGNLIASDKPFGFDEGEDREDDRPAHERGERDGRGHNDRDGRDRGRR